MARIEGPALARLAWPSALLLACQAAPAPGPARPPPPEPILVTPTPTPTPTPTWAELRAELPEAGSYLWHKINDTQLKVGGFGQRMPSGDWGRAPVHGGAPRTRRTLRRP